MKIFRLLTIFALVSGFLFTGCKKDDDNNPDPSTTTTPTIVALSPASGATGVALDKVIKITFSEAMSSTSINSAFTLKQGTNVVLGAVSYSGLIASFTPLNLLSSGTVYTATITTDAKSADGVSLAVNASWSFTTGTNTSGQQAVDLGTAGNYVILAETAISNSPTSAVTGDMAISPAFTAAITGFALVDATGYATSSQVTGKVYSANMADPVPINLTTAVNDMIAAHDNAAALPSPDFVELYTGALGGQTLYPGLYKWTNNVTAATDVVISGDADDIWIFQISGNLNLSSDVKITLVGGAQAKNIFWQVAGQATIGTRAHFEGIILSKTGITLQTNASMKGRALAQTAVVLDKNIVVKP